MAAVSEGDRMEQSLHVVHITRKNANEVGRSIPLEEISSPLVLTAVKLWEEQRGNRKFPSRNDLSPRALSAYLRNIMLYRLIGTGEDFEVRVMGDAAVYAYGTCYQGMRMSEVNRIRPGMGDVVARVCSSVLNRKAPLAFKRPALSRRMRNHQSGNRFSSCGSCGHSRGPHFVDRRL